jgi:hypothetical protein
MGAGAVVEKVAMKTASGKCLRLVLPALLPVAAALAGDGAPAETNRLWRATNGTTLEAAFETLEDGYVHLRKPDAAEVVIRLTSLCNEDRLYIGRMTTARRPAAGAGGDDKTAAAAAGRQADGIPTEEEIAAFLTTYQPPGRPERYIFTATFGVPALTPRERKAYARSGKVPYRITMDLMEAKTVGGRTFSKRVEGRGNVVVMDAAGTVIDRTKEALGKLCPS